MDLSYILYQLGEERENYFNAVSPPIIQSSNFTFKDVNSFRESRFNEQFTHVYSRGNNPTVEILRKKLSALSKADDCLVFSSGIAAISAAVLSQVKSGDHVVCIKKPYGWTEKLFSEFLKRFNIEVSFVDGFDGDSYAKATKENTVLYFLESPNSFTFEVQDIPSIVQTANKNGVKTIIDNSYAGILSQHPLEMGVDIEVQSASKYLNGHSDVVAGVLCSDQETINSIFCSEFMNLGAIISPFEAWLMIRSLRTLPLRMKTISESTSTILAFLTAHDKVESILYPFSESNPHVNLSKRQMDHSGGLFSIFVKSSSTDKVEEFCNRLNRFLIAVSWGGHESLVLPACSLFEKDVLSLETPGWNLIRFYIGLEEPEYLIEDLKAALKVL